MTDKNAPDDNNPIARRNFLLGASTTVAAGLAPTASAQAQQPTAAAPAAPAAGSEPATYLTLSQTEIAIPSMEKSRGDRSRTHVCTPGCLSVPSVESA